MTVEENIISVKNIILSRVDIYKRVQKEKRIQHNTSKHVIAKDADDRPHIVIFTTLPRFIIINEDEAMLNTIFKF